MNAAKGIMAVLIAALLLVSCNNGDDKANGGDVPDNVIAIEYWTPFSGGDNQFMTEMVDAFNREQSDIRVVQVNSRLDDYYSRLRTAILSGNAPDVAVIHTTSLPQFVHNGYIEDLTAPAEQAGIDWSSFNANILESTIYDGQSYAVPLDTHALVMYYNKTYLRQAGLLDGDEKPLIPEGPEGFRGFLERIRESVPADIAPMAHPSTRIDSVWLWWSLYNQIQGGGSFYSPDGSRAVIDNPNALRALEYVNSLYDDGLIPPNINDAFKLFIEGKAAVLVTGMWGTGAFEHTQSLDFGVVPLPTLYDQPAMWGDSHTLAIPRKHEMPDAKRAAVMIFAKWMVEHGVMWAEAGHVPSMKQVVASEDFNQLDYRSDYADAANYVAYWPRYDKQWTMVEVIIKEFERMIYDRQTPQEALRNAQATINEELSK